MKSLSILARFRQPSRQANLTNLQKDLNGDELELNQLRPLMSRGYHLYSRVHPPLFRRLTKNPDTPISAIPAVGSGSA